MIVFLPWRNGKCFCAKFSWFDCRRLLWGKNLWCEYGDSEVIRSHNNLSCCWNGCRRWGMVERLPCLLPLCCSGITRFFSTVVVCKYYDGQHIKPTHFMMPWISALRSSLGNPFLKLHESGFLEYSVGHTSKSLGFWGVFYSSASPPCNSVVTMIVFHELDKPFFYQSITGIEVVDELQEWRSSLLHHRRTLSNYNLRLLVPGDSLLASLR